MHDIYDYTDYREYLKALYEERKQANRAFSYRFIATRAGFASPSFVGKILAGDTNISQQSLLRLIEVFGLAGPEAEYLELLVNFAQSRTEIDRHHYFERMQRLRRRQRGSGRGSREALESEWFVPCVLSLVRLGLFQGDHARLALLVTPPITPQQARLAIETLSFHGWITRNADGTWSARDPESAGESIFPVEEPEDSVVSLDSSIDGGQSVFPVDLPEETDPSLRKRIAALKKELKRLVRRARRESRADASSAYEPPSSDIPPSTPD